MYNLQDKYSKQQLFNVCHFILGKKKKFVCVIVLCFMGQFYVNNLRTLWICQQVAKTALLSTAVSTEGLSITALTQIGKKRLTCKEELPFWHIRDHLSQS